VVKIKIWTLSRANVFSMTGEKNLSVDYEFERFLKFLDELVTSILSLYKFKFTKQ
jgi:hypothetical protein